MLVTRIGFTGSQRGMTGRQLNALRDRLSQLGMDEFHHGDCVGSDAQAHVAVRRVCPKARIVSHPSINPAKRAFCEADEVKESIGYKERNQEIVRVTELLIAAPSGTGTERIRSGTWWTVRMARALNRPIFIVLPSGFIVDDEKTKGFAQGGAYKFTQTRLVGE